MRKAVKHVTLLSGVIWSNLCGIITVILPSPSHFTTNGHSASISWYVAPSRSHDQMLSLWCDHYCMRRHVASSLTRGLVCHLSSVLGFVKCIHIYMLRSISIPIPYVQLTMYNIYMAFVSPGSVQQIMPYLTVHYAVTAGERHLNARRLHRNQV
jgi:hypothetical protein